MKHDEPDMPMQGGLQDLARQPSNFSVKDVRFSYLTFFSTFLLLATGLALFCESTSKAATSHEKLDFGTLMDAAVFRTLSFAVYTSILAAFATLLSAFLFLFGILKENRTFLATALVLVAIAMTIEVALFTSSLTGLKHLDKGGLEHSAAATATDAWYCSEFTQMQESLGCCGTDGTPLNITGSSCRSVDGCSTDSEDGCSTVLLSFIKSLQDELLPVLITSVLFNAMPGVFGIIAMAKLKHGKREDLQRLIN